MSSLSRWDLEQAVKKTLVTLTMIAGIVASATSLAEGRDSINIVGSSTVYPFATVVAERFGKTGGFKTPKIESTGTGGGMKLFCDGAGVDTPDITNASRRMKSTEFEACAKNGVTDILEVKIGYDGIVLANSVKGPDFSIGRKDIFLAVAKNVPNPDGTDTLVPNPYKTWEDVNGSLPAIKIEVIGPPPTSGTRDAFVELAMEAGCKEFKFLKEFSSKQSDAEAAGDKAKTEEFKKKFKDACDAVREDGGWIDGGENDNLIVQKLATNPKSLGIFGYSFLEENADTVKGAMIDGRTPNFDNISDGKYPISRPLYFYVKKSHVGKIPGIMEYVAEFTSSKAVGAEGYLAEKGLIPMLPEEFKTVNDSIKANKNLKL